MVTRRRFSAGEGLEREGGGAVGAGGPFAAVAAEPRPTLLPAPPPPPPEPERELEFES